MDVDIPDVDAGETVPGEGLRGGDDGLEVDGLRGLPLGGGGEGGVGGEGEIHGWHVGGDAGVP